MTTLDSLRSVLGTLAGPAAVAVSGGVDSLTLAAVACDTLGAEVRLYHAVSPAVPAEATRRTRALAVERSWALDIFAAGEFAAPRYRANPVNRCFFCKTSLYGSVVGRAGQATVVSGTNTDDLGEYRPGLDAARCHGVRHPFIEAGIDKQGVRAIARAVGLGGVAELPSSPCLSSRIETGIAINPAMLAMVERIEGIVRDVLEPSTVRCRVRASGLVIELDQAALARLDTGREATLRAALSTETVTRPIFASYRNGSAFLRANA